MTAFPLRDDLHRVSHVVLVWQRPPNQREGGEREPRRDGGVRGTRELPGSNSSTDWMARLQRVTSALSESLTEERVGDVVVNEGAEAVQADTVLLYVTSPSSSSGRLELLAHRGLDGSSGALAQLDLASGVPASEVVTSVKPSSSKPVHLSSMGHGQRPRSPCWLGSAPSAHSR